MLPGHQRPRRHQPGHRHRRRLHGLDPDGRHHRAGARRPDRQRRLPGGRHHRHHAARHQAQLPGDQDAEDLPRVMHEAFHIAAHRPARAGADRHPDGHPAASIDYEPARRGRPAGLQADHCRATPARSERRRRRIDRGRSGRCSTWAAASSSPAPPPSCPRWPTRRSIPVTTTLMGLGAFPETHPLALGMLGMHGTAPPTTPCTNATADRRRRALRRPRHRQARGVRAAGARSSTSTSTRPRSARTCSARHPRRGRRQARPDALLDELVKPRERTPTGCAQIAEWKSEYPFNYEPRDGELKPQYVIEKI